MWCGDRMTPHVLGDSSRSRCRLHVTPSRRHIAHLKPLGWDSESVNSLFLPLVYPMVFSIHGWGFFYHSSPVCQQAFFIEVSWESSAQSQSRAGAHYLNEQRAPMRKGLPVMGAGWETTRHLGKAHMEQSWLSPTCKVLKSETPATCNSPLRCVRMKS